MSLNRLTKWHAQYAAHVIRSGGVVAHPTEAVWGLACDPSNQQAVSKILTLKQRPLEKGLILVSGHRAHFQHLLTDLPEEYQQRFFSKRDRPTTWLVPDHQKRIPFFIKGKFSSVALRLSEHPLVVELTKQTGFPLVSTSANPSGKSPAADFQQARAYFMGHVDYFCRGALGGYSAPSEIRDLMTGDVVRV